MTEKTTAYDITVDIVLALGVAVQAYIIVDTLSDGRLTRELSMKTLKVRAKIKEWYDRERAVRKHTGAVIFDAITTIEDAGNNGSDSGRD